MNNTQPTEKSRDLSNYEFLQALQVEWIVADLRSKIYYKHKDKEFWKRVKAGKKLKIDDIADRNALATIFSDGGLEKELKTKVYNPTGLPSFSYKNEKNRAELEYYDLLHYFNKGSDVKVDYFGEIKIGKIIEYKPYFNDIKVKLIEGGEFATTIDKVTRIL